MNGVWGRSSEKKTSFNQDQKKFGTSFSQSSVVVQRIFGRLGAVGFGIFAVNAVAPVMQVQSERKIISLENAIEECRLILTKIQTETRCPGISVAATVDGKIVWKEGFGFSDLENRVPCTPDTVMKLASISKPISATILAKEWELCQFDLDSDIGSYVPDWPKHDWKSEQVNITVRQLASHTAGIRGYKKMESGDKDDYEEYHIVDRYKSVSEALKLFKDDPLISRPGTEFFYSNHGFTLLSAALEGATKKSFTDLLEKHFKNLGLENTCIEDPTKIIYNLSRHYIKKDGEVLNAPYVESSFKIAGAGLLSNVIDLVKFGNSVLYSSQSKEGDKPESYLKSSTVNMLWTPVDNTSVSWHPSGQYGMGWQIVPDNGTRYFGHTGGSIGISSVLIVHPAESSNTDDRPHGVVVAILANIQGISLGKIGVEIADCFERTR